MNISEKQIEQISKYISVLDIKSYIEEHLLEYEQLCVIVYIYKYIIIYFLLRVNHKI